MLLPIKLFEFWYLEGFLFFARSLSNSLKFLEEDLAVSLMARLIFVPLFHDTSIFGRGMSFVFRSARIVMGLMAFLLAILIIIVLAFLWFTAPILGPLILLTSLPKEISLVFFLIILVGLGIFIYNLIDKPLKKIWQIKDKSQIWQTTKLSPNQVTWNNLLQTPEVKELITSMELSLNNFENLQIAVTPSLLEKTLQLAKITNSPYVDGAHFWVAMLLNIPRIERALLKYNLRTNDFIEGLTFQEFKKNKWRTINLWDDDFGVRHLKGVNRGWLGAPTPNLDAISTDLTKMAVTLGFPDFIGRQAVLTQVINILSQQKDRNVLLVGQPGSGRTALVHHLAKWITSGDAPDTLATKRLVELDLTKLMANVKSEGDLATKIKAAFEEVQFIQDIIIFVDELHNLGMGEAGGSYNLYSLMLPYLESDQFQFIASTESASYARIIEKNGSFARIFHKVDVPSATVPETIEIIENRVVDSSGKKRINITFLAIKELVQFAAKLIHDRVLPDSALTILDECLSQVKGEKISSQIVKQVLEQRVSVPLVEVDESHKQLLLNLEAVIHQKMIDQEEAVNVVANTLRRSATSLREQGRPIGTFLFVGPTGVGKTELAKTLAEVYFKTSGAFIRFDMSEYQTQEAVNRLIGTELNPGELTETIKNKPYALVLLDEFEKANPQLLTLFLQVLEEGRLTDYSGTHVDFTNTIIIATSNAASLTIAENLQKGWSIKQLEPLVKDELLKVFKPELVNRFDEVVIFKPLSQEDLQKIVRIKLGSVEKMLNEQGYLIEFTPGLVTELAKKGFDPVLGARPLRRLIQDTLEARLSRMILENKLIRGEPFTADEKLLS